MRITNLSQVGFSALPASSLLEYTAEKKNCSLGSRLNCLLGSRLIACLDGLIVLLVFQEVISLPLECRCTSSCYNQDQSKTAVKATNNELAMKSFTT
ncbi:hypothetical protein EON65_37815 [archaeon]|nr:MAG: hypothetical protein EON65_37815 [archaeon]